MSLSDQEFRKLKDGINTTDTAKLERIIFETLTEMIEDNEAADRAVKELLSEMNLTVESPQENINLDQVLIEQESFLKSLETAIAGVNDSVAFAMGNEKISVMCSGQSMALTADELVKATKKYKAPVGILASYLPNKVGTLLNSLEINKEADNSTEANIYNIQRLIDLGCRNVASEQQKKDHIHFTCYALKQDDFKGDYIRTMGRIIETTTSEDQKDIAKQGIHHYLCWQSTFDEKLDSVKNPPIEMSLDQRKEVLQHANIDLDIGRANVHDGKKKIIDTIIEDPEMEQNSGDLMTLIVTQQAENLSYSLRDQTSSKEQRVANQSAYLAGIKELMIQTQKYPELQQICANQVVQDAVNLDTKQTRSAALGLVKEICPDTPAAGAAEKYKTSAEEKFITFCENVEFIATKTLGNTLVGDMLGVPRREKNTVFNSRA